MQAHSKLIKSILIFERKAPKYIKILPYILRKVVLEMFYSCEIQPDSFNSIEAIRTLDIPHPYGIIIHPKCKINTNVKIYQFVTIGALEKEEYRGALISNNVTIGAKASLLGNISIGEDSKIGAHALVLRSCNREDKVVGVFK